jgi:antitoxin VapB
MRAAPMSLNLKSPEAHRLAAELARLTGESMTKAVTEAIRERLERETRRRHAATLAQELLAIGRRCAANMPVLAGPASGACRRVLYNLGDSSILDHLF